MVWLVGPQVPAAGGAPGARGSRGSFHSGTEVFARRAASGSAMAARMRRGAMRLPRDEREDARLSAGAWAAMGAVNIACMVRVASDVAAGALLATRSRWDLARVR